MTGRALIVGQSVNLGVNFTNINWKCMVMCIVRNITGIRHFRVEIAYFVIDGLSIGILFAITKRFARLIQMQFL